MGKLGFIIILIGILLGSCAIKQSPNGKDKKFPVLIDTFGIDKTIRFKIDEMYLKKSTANYLIYFIGKYNDTIFLNPSLNFTTPPPIHNNTLNKCSQTIHTKRPFAEYYLEWTKKGKYKSAEESTVEIKIDTIKTILNFNSVLITNISSDTIIIGYGERIPLILEAKDNNGKWRPIQKHFIYGCSMGVGSLFLPPKESVLTLTPTFDGDFKTHLRFSLGKNYSIEYIGLINYHQFQIETEVMGN